MAVPAPLLTSPGSRPEAYLRVARRAVAQARAVPPTGPASGSGRVLFWVLAGAAVGFALWLVIRAQGGSKLDPDQAWFWREGWFAGEVEADQQIAAGKLTHHDSDEAFLRSLADRTKSK